MNNFKEYLNTLFSDCRVFENLNGHFNFVIKPIKLKERNNLRGVIGATVNNYDRINKDKSEEEKFNVFFDKNNTNAYDINKDLYTIYFDFDKDYTDNFLINFNNKFSLIVFDWSTIKFLRKIKTIQYFLNFLESDGKLFLPIKYQSDTGYKFVSKEQFTNEYGAIHFNDTMTYRLTDKDKIEEIINSDDMDIIPYFIWTSPDTYYQPDLSQIDYIFTEKIKRVINNSEETYEIVKEDYPTGLKMNTSFIVIQKN